MLVMSHSNPSLWTQLPQSSRSPCDRYKHACCSYDGNVYVLGGRDHGCLGDFWKYNVVFNEWTELNCTGEAAPEELEEHSMVAHEGFLYVFGGMLESSYTRSRCPLWVFDAVKQKWVHCHGKSSSTQRPRNRKGHSVVVIGSAMLIYGGYMDLKGSSQELWRLDFDTTVWSLLSSSESGSSGPGPRYNHSAVAYQGSMFLFGGLKGLQEKRDFWKWNSTNHTWTCLKMRAAPPKLMGHSALVYKDCMLLFGGAESQSSPHSVLWRYSFTTQTWSKVSSLLGSGPPGKVHHCCAGLGPSYSTSSFSSELRHADRKPRPFQNKCFPAPFTVLESEEAIEMETFRSGSSCQSYRLSSSALDSSGTSVTGKDPELIGSCLTFENQASTRHWICSDKTLLEQEEEDITKHLPDMLLVLGGRPYSRKCPISTWQMTLTDS